MDALYSKLYATYNEFKTNKFTEMEKLNRNQEEKFLAFTNAADELLQQYIIENDRLLAENEDLRSELALTRSSMDDKIAEYQKLLMEENQKKKNFYKKQRGCKVYSGRDFVAFLGMRKMRSQVHLTGLRLDQIQ